MLTIMRLAPAVLAFLLSATVAAQDEAVEPPLVTEEPEGFRFGGEIKAGFRWSQAQSSSIFGASNRVVGFMRTPHAGSSIPKSSTAFPARVRDLGVFAKFEVRFRYGNRNPIEGRHGSCAKPRAFRREGDSERGQGLRSMPCSGWHRGSASRPRAD
jgi:hypothetical protein